jgi:hypothetical protein
MRYSLVRTQLDEAVPLQLFQQSQRLVWRQFEQ